MAFTLGDILARKPPHRACWPKVRHETPDTAEAQIRSLAARNGPDDRLGTYRCSACAGYHVGHHTEGVEKMAHPTFDDFLQNTPAAVAFRKAATPTVTKAALRPPRVAPIAKAVSAVDELEALVATRLQARPELTRQSVVGEIFQAQPDLYDRVRAETTLDAHGRTLREVYARAEAGTPSLAKAESVDAEVVRRVNALVSKTSGATFKQALAFVGREDPELLARWQREAYA